MYKTDTCRACGKELTGAIETTLVPQGEFVEIVSRETGDCNWRLCKGCKNVLCKKCYSEQRDYCCEEGRIVDRERAQFEIAGQDPDNHVNSPAIGF